MLGGLFVLKSSMHMSCCPLNQRCSLVGLSTNGGFAVHIHNMKMLVSITGACMNFVTVVYGLAHASHMPFTCSSHASRMPSHASHMHLTCTSHVCVLTSVFQVICIYHKHYLDKLNSFMHVVVCLFRFLKILLSSLFSSLQCAQHFTCWSLVVY